MFNSVHLALAPLPGALAVATLVICTFFAIASGMVGAVVMLMGVMAMRPMLTPATASGWPPASSRPAAAWAS